MTMNVNPVSFQGEQPQRKSGIGTGIVLGGLTGAGTYFAHQKWGKAPMTQDTFTSSLKEGKTIEYKSELTADEKALVEKAEKEAKAEAPKATETKAATTAAPEAKASAPVKNAKSLATDLTAEEIFFKDAEMSTKDYLQSKYGASSTQELIDQIKDEERTLAGNNTPKALKKEQNKMAAMKTLQRDHSTAIGLENKINAKNAEIKMQEALKEGLPVDSPKAKSIQRRIDALNKEVTTLTAQKGKITKLKVPSGSSAYTTNIKELNDQISKAKKNGGRAFVDGEKAAADKLKELQEIAGNEARNNCKGKGMTPAQVQVEIDNAKKAVKTDATAQAAIDKVRTAAVNKKVADIRGTFIEQQSKAHYETMVKKQQHAINKLQTGGARANARIAEMKSDLALVRNAKKNGGKITREAAEGVISGAKATAKETVAAASKAAGEATKTESALTKAFEAVKGKLPEAKPKGSKSAWIAAAVGGGVLVLSSLMGGKKETPEA